MLKRGIKLLLSLLPILSLLSCGGSRSKSAVYVKNNFHSYSSIHNLIKDSLIMYIDSGLVEFTPEYMYGWSVDSFVCVNSSQDRLVAMTIEIPNSGKGFLSDDAMKLLGKKINNKWYFFRGGGTLTMPRKIYGYSESNPPSSIFLSQIARKEFLEPSLITNEAGDYIVDDKWIDDHFYYNGMCAHCKTQAQYDSTHWDKIMRKWKEKIDTNEYKPVKRNKPAS